MFVCFKSEQIIHKKLKNKNFLQIPFSDEILYYRVTFKFDEDVHLNLILKK